MATNKEEIELQEIEIKSQPAVDDVARASTLPVKKSSKSVFRYSTVSDKLLMLLGTLLAIVAGFVVPLYVVLIGLAITDFAYHNIATTNISFSDSVCDRNSSARDDLLEYIRSSDPDDLLLSNVCMYCIGLACMGVVYFVTLFLSISLWSKAGVNQTKAIRCSFISTLLRRNMTWYDYNSAAEKPTQLASAMFKIDEGIGSNMAKLFTEASLILSHLIIAIVINWALALLLLVLFPVTVVIVLVVAKVAAKVQAKEQDVFEKAGAIAEETIAAIKTVMAFGGERKACERYDALLKDLKKNSNIIHSLRAVVLGSVTFILFLIYGAGFWFGSFLLIDCFPITFGDIVIVTIEMSGAVYALVDLFPLKKSLDAAKEAAAKLYEIIDEEGSTDESAESYSPNSLDGDIEFQNVTFSYPSRSTSSAPVLEDISITIRPGQTVALVGPSGCGKSTILQLLLRLYDHRSGTITVNGVDIRNVSVQWLRNQMGVVSQEPVLFNATVRDNIAMGREGASLEEIKAAARTANAHKFITELPRGYNTEVGESGAQLSGGQKQRIAIARALIRNPKILLLDEATSALDTESEEIVQEALDKAKEGRTTIVIAHRLSTIRNADVIISLQDGHVVEQGTHEQLMFMRGLYHQLVMKQVHLESHAATPDFKKSVTRTNIERSKSIKHGKRPLLSKPSEDSIDFNVTLRSLTLKSSLGEGKYSLPRGSVHQLSTIRESIDGEAPSLPPGAVNRSLKDMFLYFKYGWLLMVVGVVGFTCVGVAIASLYLLVKESLKAFSLRGDLLEDIRDPSIGLIVLGIAAMILQLIGALSLGVASTKLAEYFRSLSFRSIMRQEAKWFDRQENSTPLLIAQLATDADQIKEIVEVRLGYAVKSVATLIATVVIAFVSTWAVTLVLLPGLVILLIVGYVQIRISKRYAGKSQGFLEESIKTSAEAILNIRTVATLGIADRVQRKYEGELTQPTRYHLKSEVLNAFLYATAQGVFVLLMSAGLYVSAVLATVDTDMPYYAPFFDSGTALSALYFMSILFKRVWNLLPDLRKGKESCQRIIHLLQSNPDIDSWSSEGETLDDVAGNIAVENVTFQYETRQDPILKTLSMCVKPNSTLAIVGTSGSGKSTIVSLIERFYSVSSGLIKLDGVHLQALNTSWLRRQIGLVSQEPVLFDMSIADNIRYGANHRDDITEDEIIAAARIANIHDFIDTQPHGYDTDVGLKGTQLSGGEKQRIAIARALIRNPKILLLDEATSALDTESEEIVQEALDKAKEGRTTIVIAHRLSTIRNADVIIVLHEGKVLEQGTHEELMDKEGAYYYMNMKN